MSHQYPPQQPWMQPGTDQQGPPFPQQMPGQVPQQQWGQPQPPAPKKKHTVRNVILVGVGVIFMMGIISAIADSNSPSTVGLSPTTTAQAAADESSGPAETDAAASTQPASTLPDGVYHFGDTVRFDNGSTLHAGRPVAFTPDEYAFGGDKSRHHLKVRLTFKNGTDKVVNLSGSDGSASSADREAESVYQDGLDAPDNKLLPGHEVTWWMGYGTKSATHLTLTVRMGFLDGYDDVIFTNEQ